MLRQIAKASEVIRRKHRMLKLGKEAAEQMMSETFKPIVMPLQKLVDISNPPTKIEVKENAPKKKGEEEDENASFMTADSEQAEHDTTMIEGVASEAAAADNYDYLTKKFLRMLHQNRKQYLDMVYGVRKLSDDTLMIGDKPISFEGQYIHVGDKKYLKTVCLLELPFRQTPEESYISSDDLNNYKDILIATNAHRKQYSPSEPVCTSRSINHKKFIAKLFNVSRRRSSTSGGSLPQYMIARKNENTDYVYWDDPNELVERLCLLLASQAAGNPSHNNEIISIIEELREAGIIY